MVTAVRCHSVVSRARSGAERLGIDDVHLRIDRSDRAERVRIQLAGIPAHGSILHPEPSNERYVRFVLGAVGDACGRQTAVGLFDSLGDQGRQSFGVRVAERAAARDKVVERRVAENRRPGVGVGGRDHRVVGRESRLLGDDPPRLDDHGAWQTDQVARHHRDFRLSIVEDRRLGVEVVEHALAASRTIVTGHRRAQRRSYLDRSGACAELARQGDTGQQGHKASTDGRHKGKGAGD